MIYLGCPGLGFPPQPKQPNNVKFSLKILTMPTKNIPENKRKRLPPFLRRKAEVWNWEPVFCMRWSLLTNQRAPLRLALPNGPRQESEELVCVWLRARLPPSSITAGYCRSNLGLPESTTVGRVYLRDWVEGFEYYLQAFVKRQKNIPKIGNCLFSVCLYRVLILQKKF